MTKINHLGNLGGGVFCAVLLHNVGASNLEVFIGIVGFLFAIGFIKRTGE